MLDIATLSGLILAFGLVTFAIALGGDVVSFLNLPSFLIVVAGTFGVVTASYKLSEIVKAQRLMLQTLFYRIPDLGSEARYMVELAQKARASGTLSIQADLGHIHDAFLRKGLALAIDGTQADTIEYLLNLETARMMERHARGIAIFRKSAEVAPALGLVGTLIGLVQMLHNLSNPAAIGPAMAVALLTTLYGALLAFMFFNPLATKLERNSAEEVRLRHIYTHAVLSIAKQENPRQLEMMLNTILPPARRITVFD